MPRPIPALAAALLLPFCAIAQDDRLPEAFQLGLGLQQRGLHEEAAAQFAAFLQQNSRHALAAEAAYRRGTCLLQIDQKEAGIASLQQALRAGGAQFALRHEARYRLGLALHEDKKVQQANDELVRLLADLPKDHYLGAGASYALGECQRDLGDDRAALQSFDAAVQRATGEAAAFLFPAHYQAGFAALRLQQPKVGALHFGAAASAATAADARHECQYLAGDAALRANDLDQAQQWLEQSQKGPGDYVDDSELALGFLAVARGDAKTARQRFQQLAQARGDSPLRARAQLELGRLCYQQKDYAAAEQALLPLRDHQDAAVQQPAKELLGLCALASGHGDAAIEPLRQALAAAPAPEQPRLSFALAEALADAGKYADALAPYDAAARTDDAALRGDALYGSCFALHQLGKYDESTARAATLRKELPQHRLVALATFAVGENLFAQRKYEAAQQEYAAVPAGSDCRGKAEFKLAWCRYLQGDKKDASQRFAAIAGQKDHPHAEEALSMAALALLEGGDADKALLAADAYKARYPKGAYLDRTERIASRVLRTRGDLAGAAQRLDNAGKATKDAGADRLEQAELQFQRGDFAAAAAIYQDLVQRTDAVGARAYEGWAWCAFELGDDKACAERLQQAGKHPQQKTVEPALLELASALHHRQQDWPAAIADAQRFLAAYKDHGKAPAMRYALGTAQARSGANAEARRTLQALAEAGGYERMDRVQYELAWACRRSGDEKAALQGFRAVAEQSKDQDLCGEARLHVGTALLQQKDVDGARKQLEAVQGRYRGRALYTIAFRDLEQSQQEPALLAKAEQAFTEIAAIADEPLAPEAEFLCGECRRRAGDAAGASKHWKALLDKAPQHERAPLARLCLAEAAVQLGDGNTAVEQSQRVLAEPPKDKTEQARAQLALGRGRQLRGENDRAEQALQKATELSEGQIAAEAQFRIGEARAAAGNLQGAVDAFVKLPILYAHAEWVQKGLLQAGLCCEKLNQPDKARRFFEELVQRFPQAAEAATAKSRLSQKRQ